MSLHTCSLFGQQCNRDSVTQHNPITGNLERDVSLMGVRLQPSRPIKELCLLFAGVSPRPPRCRFAARLLQFLDWAAPAGGMKLKQTSQMCLQIRTRNWSRGRNDVKVEVLCSFSGTVDCSSEAKQTASLV